MAREDPHPPPPATHGGESICGPARLEIGSEVSQGRPALPGTLGFCLMACGVDHLSLATRASVGRPTGSTSCYLSLGNVSHGMQCRPAVLGDSGP